MENACYWQFSQGKASKKNLRSRLDATNILQYIFCVYCSDYAKCCSSHFNSFLFSFLYALDWNGCVWLIGKGARQRQMWAKKRLGVCCVCVFVFVSAECNLPERSFDISEMCSLAAYHYHSIVAIVSADRRSNKYPQSYNFSVSMYSIRFVFASSSYHPMN